MKVTFLAAAAALVIASAAQVATDVQAGVEPRASGVGNVEIKVLSNRADLLSGGDALVEVVLPTSTEVSDLRVRLSLVGAESDVTSAFALRPNGRVQGLVTGLPLGKNELLASLGAHNARLGRMKLTNYPIGGPIFAGPQVQLWICETVEAGLGPAQDAQCNAATKVQIKV